MADLTSVMAETDGVEVGIAYRAFSEGSRLLKDLEENPRIRIHDLTGMSPYSLTYLKTLRKLSRDYDLVHVHLFPYLYLTPLATAGLKTPLVFTEHSTHNRRRGKAYLKPLEKLAYGRYRAIAAISRPTETALKKWLGSSKASQRILTISNGVDLKRFSPDLREAGRKAFGREGKAIVMVSRFAEAKDQATVVRALPHIEDKEIYAVFAGDGPTLESCRQLAASLGVDDRCVFLGRRDDIPAIAAGAFIGVQSSKWEGFGLPVIEFMSAGVPVIASDVDGLNGIVAGAGLLFEPGNEKDLAEKINSLSSRPEEYERLRALGLKRASDYSIETTAEHYVKLYREILE